MIDKTEAARQIAPLLVAPIEPEGREKPKRAPIPVSPLGRYGYMPRLIARDSCRGSRKLHFQVFWKSLQLFRGDYLRISRRALEMRSADIPFERIYLNRAAIDIELIRLRCAALMFLAGWPVENWSASAFERLNNLVQSSSPVTGTATI